MSFTGSPTTPTDRPTQEPTTPPTQEPTALPTGHPDPTTGCAAMLTVGATWPGGWLGEVMVHASDSPLTTWTVEVQGATLQQAWNGTLSGARTITSAAWNGSVPAHGSTTTGFIGQGSPTTQTPTCSAS